MEVEEQRRNRFSKTRIVADYVPYLFSIFVLCRFTKRQDEAISFKQI